MAATILLLAGVVLAPPTLVAGLYWLAARGLGRPDPSFGLFADLVAAWGALLVVAIIAYERER